MNRIGYGSAAILISLLAFSGCAVPSAPPPPAQGSTLPVDAPLQKLISPAFADDYADKTVRFMANYIGPTPTMIDLPPEYQQGFVRISLMDGGAVALNVLVPKEYADATFALKTSERVQVTAYAQPMNRFGLMGNGESALLLIADSILPASVPPPHRKTAQKRGK